jgi:predicted transcriptional regulator
MAKPSMKIRIATRRWQIEHIRQGLREADAGKFASARAVKQVMDRLRRPRSLDEANSC